MEPHTEVSLGSLMAALLAGLFVCWFLLVPLQAIYKTNVRAALCSLGSSQHSPQGTGRPVWETCHMMVQVGALLPVLLLTIPTPGNLPYGALQSLTLHEDWDPDLAGHTTAWGQDSGQGRVKWLSTSGSWTGKRSSNRLKHPSNPSPETNKSRLKLKTDWNYENFRMSCDHLTFWHPTRAGVPKWRY